MEQFFSGYPCAIIVDDIIIRGCNAADNNINLKRVLNWCEVKLKPKAKANPSKTKAISEMWAPKDVPALQRLLGMANYLGKFIPNFSDISVPLRMLTHKETVWCWYQQQQHAFDMLKSCLSTPPVLSYSDARKPVTLTCNASCFGLGVACIQEGRPVA